MPTPARPLLVSAFGACLALGLAFAAPSRQGQAEVVVETRPVSG